MKCVRLEKYNNNVYMVDDEDNKINLNEDEMTSSYEQINNITLASMINAYLLTMDKNFELIISQIKDIDKKYSIYYYIYGDGIEVTENDLAIKYDLQNPNSNINCALKVFCNAENNNNIRYMIEFSKGAIGHSRYGFCFYRYFDCNSFCHINNILGRYFNITDSDMDDEIIQEINR